MKERTPMQIKHDALRQRQSLPLDAKVAMSKVRIRQWLEKFDDATVSVSGRDSYVLWDLVKQVDPGVPGVHAVANEYPEVGRHAKEQGCVLLGPSRPFRRVVEEDGWPVVSKKVAMMIARLRRPDGVAEATKHLYLTGQTQDGRILSSWILPRKWRFLLDAPFLISEKCCHCLKTGPLRRYNKHPIVGTLAVESRMRRGVYHRHGCNIYSGKNTRSAPMSFWLEEDVLAYAEVGNISIPPIYAMGYHGTGCMFCMFGCQFEPTPNRFQLLRDTHPKQYAVFQKLGGEKVLDFLGVPHD